MLEVEKAGFSFESFKVPRFTFDGNNHSGAIIKMGFSPSGRYISKTGEFELTIKFISYEEDNKDKIIFGLTAISKFKFKTSILYTEIPDFFYQNAIAITFPYVRAFISTLTLQSNTKLLQLDLMNLSNLEKPLIDNTVEI